jgi:hypothetical protein
MRRIVTYKRDDGSVISTSSITLEKDSRSRHGDGLVYRVIHSRHIYVWREPLPDDYLVEHSASLGYAIRLADEYARSTDRRGL